MDNTAGRLRRLVAATIDEAAFLGGLFPISADRLFPGDTSWMVAGLLIVSLLLVQFFLLVVRGQSIGKVLLGIRIVALNGERGTFGAVVMVRTIANSLFCLLPGAGWVYFLVDSLCVFRADRRCLHDLLAGTRVVRVGPAQHLVSGPKLGRNVV